MRTYYRNRIQLAAFLLFLLPFALMAQQVTVTGRVTDTTGEPIPGATVHNMSQPALGTITDIDGRFSLKTDGLPNLEISFLGFKSKQVKATTSPMKIVLEEAVQSLSEVVVVGYGTQKKVNLTGAVEQVSEEVFENRSVSSVSQALQGTVPNLNISLEDGKPGRSASYNVRGTTSIGQGGSALVLIDGVEGDPTMLNPNDIASVSVLKDAASAAIYGARGSFGVVLITTKGAQTGKVSVNYTGNFSMQSPTNTPDYVSDGVIWAEHFREAFYNYNKTLPTSMNSIQAYSDEWLAEFKRRKEAGITSEVERRDNGSYVYYGNTDWYDLLYKDQTFAQDHNITISGGGEKADFYLSGRFYKYNGLYNYNPDTYQSINLRAKGSLQVFDWLRISNNMEFTNTDHHNPTVASYSYTAQRYIEVSSFPTMPVFNPDGSYTKCAAYTIGGFKDGTNYQDRNNKLLKNTTAFSTKFLNDRLHVNGDFTFRYKAYDNLRKRTRVTYSEKENSFSTLGSYDDIQRGFATTLYTATNLYADYEQTFGSNHYFKAMGGYNYETSKYKSMSANRNGVLLEDAASIALALGDAITLNESITNWRIMGLFFRLNYGYKDRYLFEVNGRYDGSSKFPSDQQYAFFPSFSAGWRLSEEPFWKAWTNEFFDNLKIRASYGSLGNGNVNPYSFLELLSIKTSGRVLEGGKPNYTSAPAVIPNSLTWETATTTDIGVDMSMLNGRLQLSGDYYIRKTQDMYTVGVTLPEVFGATSPKGNYADMTTRGWELSVSYRDQFNLAGKPFHWGIKGTLHDYKSKIDKYNNATKSLDDYYEGQTIGEMWGYRTDGFFQSDAETEGYVNTIVQSSVDGVWEAGDLKFVDLNKNGRIDYGDNTADNPGDKVILGNSEPRYIYSFTLNADWNGIFVSAFFQGVGKQDWFPGKESSFWGQYNRPYNSLPSWHLGNYWTPDNPDAYLPRYSTYNSALGWGNVITDRYIQNVAYLRLKNLQIGYNLPKALVAKAGMQSIRVYLTGENLLCWSPLYRRTKDLDVTTATTGTDSDLGSNNMGDGNGYPLMRSVSLGLSITF